MSSSARLFIIIISIWLGRVRARSLARPLAADLRAHLPLPPAQRQQPVDIPASEREKSESKRVGHSHANDDDVRLRVSTNEHLRLKAKG